MKNSDKVLYVLLLSLPISCKLYESKKRDKQTETAIDWQHGEQHQQFYSFRRDTLSSHWFFWTDSTFRFHVDSGLFAQQGSLLWQGAAGSTHKHIQDLTEKNEHGKQTTSKYERKSNKRLSVEYFWIVGFVLVLLIVWRWGRSRLFL